MKRTIELVEKIKKDLYGNLTESEINFELKVIEQEIQDIMADEVESEVADLIDSECKDLILSIDDLLDFYIELIDEITDWDSFSRKYKISTKCYKLLYEEFSKLKKLIEVDGILDKKCSDFVISKTKPTLDRLDSMVKFCARSGRFTKQQGINMFAKANSLRINIADFTGIVYGGMIKSYADIGIDYLEKFDEANYRYSEKIDKIEEEVKNIKITKEEKDVLKKILSQREAEEFAKENGYSKSRQSADHMIYKNEEGKVMVIPAHGKQFGKEMGYILQQNLKSNKGEV